MSPLVVVARRLFGPAVLVAVVAPLVWASAAFGLSNDGTVTVEYSGTIDQTFVYQQSDPAVWQGTYNLVWDEKQTYALSGREENEPTTTLLTRSLTVSGSVTNTFAPPNQPLSCSGSLSARASGPDPMTAHYGGTPLKFGVTADVPRSGLFIQSSAPDASHCGSPDHSGGAGFVPPEEAIAKEVSASPALGEVVVPSDPYSMSYPASGTATGSDKNVTESFHSLLQITTNGGAAGPSKPPRLNPVKVQAKRNALEALKQTLPASLYPCFQAALGATLLGAGLPGAVAGGTLIAIGGTLCASYYATIIAEVRTVQDPPRSDYGVVARPRLAVASRSAGCQHRRGAVRGVCEQGSAAAAKLLAAARTTARLARAIETTIARESGAEKAHSKAGAALQNRALIKLSRQFKDARRTEAAAGGRLSQIISAHHATIKLTAAQTGTADQMLLSGLARRGLSAADRTYTGSLLPVRPFDVLHTLGH